MSDFHYPGLDTTVSCFAHLMLPSHTRVIDGESLWSDSRLLLRNYGSGHQVHFHRIIAHFIASGNMYVPSCMACHLSLAGYSNVGNYDEFGA